MAIASTQNILSAVDEASLAGKAYEVLEELIVTLQLTPGQVLSEAGLAKQLGIGRTPVREALQQLAREGLVSILPRRGVIVSEINVKNQMELLRVRREVERLMARLAAERCRPNEARELLEIGAAMRATAASNDQLEFIRLDHRLHELIGHTCRNDFARRTMGLMQGLSRRFWYMHYREVLDLPRCAKLHADLAELAGKHDPHAAAKASDKLLDYVESFTRESLNAGGQENGYPCAEAAENASTM